MYLQLDVVRALTASAIVSILNANRWYHVSIITEDTYADDGFVDAFYALTTAPSHSRSRRDGVPGNWTAADWSVEDHILVSRRSTLDEVDRRLLVLLENHSRVIVLHSRSAAKGAIKSKIKHAIKLKTSPLQNLHNCCATVAALISILF